MAIASQSRNLGEYLVVKSTKVLSPQVLTLSSARKTSAGVGTAETIGRRKLAAASVRRSWVNLAMLTVGRFFREGEGVGRRSCRVGSWKEGGCLVVVTSRLLDDVQAEDLNRWGVSA